MVLTGRKAWMIAKCANLQPMVVRVRDDSFEPRAGAKSNASVGRRWHFARLKVEAVRDFETGLNAHMKAKYKEVLSAIVATGKLEKASAETHVKAIQEFKDRFVKDNAAAVAASFSLLLTDFWIP